MNFNLISAIETCYVTISDNSSVIDLINYSHIPTALIALVIGLFVFNKSKESLLGRLLLLISITFASWSFFDWLTWTSYNSKIIMASWSLLGLLDVLLFILSLYFAYVYFDKKDVSFLHKIIFSLFLIPAIILTPTSLNLSGFDIVNCEAMEGAYFTYYYYAASCFLFLWFLILSFNRYRNAEKVFKRQILLLLSGMSLFLFSFFVSGFLASYLGDYTLLAYGMFGMVAFMAFLAYLIVEFGVFNIKLISSQALVVSLILLVGSQFFFVQNMTSNILTGVTLIFVGGVGIALMRSVKQEVERKEELQEMANKLAVANDELRKLDNAKTEFISIASHQLRTPITAIKGFSSLLLEGSYGEVSESVHGALNKIYVSAERLVNLIEELLNVSRIESGRLQYEFKSESVEKIIQELYDNFILIAKTKKFYLDLKFPKTKLPQVVMDAPKIRELISNFIDNALKYTESGGVTVSAEIRDNGVVIDEKGFVIENKKSEFGKVVRITVSDTGIGIPKEEIPYLFKKFSRGKDVSRLHVGGTGLGLYVGKAIAEAHHGQVWVESDGAGMGSRFIIEIPVEHV